MTYFCPIIKDECPGKDCILYGEADETEVCALTEAVWAIKNMRDSVESLEEEVAMLREVIEKK